MKLDLVYMMAGLIQRPCSSHSRTEGARLQCGASHLWLVTITRCIPRGQFLAQDQADKRRELYAWDGQLGLGDNQMGIEAKPWLPLRTSML